MNGNLEDKIAAHINLQTCCKFSGFNTATFYVGMIQKHYIDNYILSLLFTH